MKHALLAKVRAFLLSFRWKTTPLGVISVYVGGLVAGAAYTSIELLMAVVSSFFVGSASMMINDFFDWKIDAVSHPERPIPKGIIRPKEMLAVSILFFAIGIGISLFLNLVCVGILLATIVLILLYELYSKNRGIFSNFTVGLASAASFVFGGAVVFNPLAPLILSVITFLVMTGREIICDIKDIEGDRLVRRTLPIQIGKQNAASIAGIFLFVSLICLPVPYFLHLVSLWYLLLMIPVGVLIFKAALWVLRDTDRAGASSSLIRISCAFALVALFAGIFL